MHKLSASFILGYHGCDAAVAERLLKNQAFRPSQNDYDWLGDGVYFWEANPLRGLQFVINYLHHLEAEENRPAFDTVKGIFIEAPDLYPGSAFGSKNHIQIAVRNLDCIKGVFRVPKSHLAG